jgi:hypothetical protein
MQSNHDATLELPLMCNLITWLWSALAFINLLWHHLSKYFVLAKLYLVMILGNVEYEHCFSTLSFLKSKLHSRLTKHLDLVVKMFPYDHYTLDFLTRMPWKIRMSIRWGMHHTTRFLICYVSISWCKFFYYFYCTCMVATSYLLWCEDYSWWSTF